MSCWQDVEFLSFYILIAYRTYYPTEKILYFGILGNILLGSGTAYLLEKGLNRKYQNWIPKGDAYYQEWRAEMKKMEHLLQVIGILAFAAAGIFFVLQSKFREYWSWYYNYAAGYVMLLQHCSSIWCGSLCADGLMRRNEKC